MTRIFLLLTIILSVNCFATTPLKVAVVIDPPFVFQEDGKLQGISIELWEQIAVDNKIMFSYHIDTAEQIVLGVEQGKYDVGVGSLSITSNREEHISFSSPYYQSGLALLTKYDSPSFFTSPLLIQVIKLICFIIAVIYIGALILFLVERKHNTDLDTIEESAWWAIVTITTTGYGDKVPKTTFGRLLASVFMICGAIIFPTIIGGLGAISIIEHRNKQVDNIGQISKYSIAVVKDTISYTYAQQNNLKFIAADTFDEMIEMVKTDKVRAALYDAPMLQLVANSHKDLILVDGVVMRHFYGFVVETNNDLLEDINRSIPQLVSSNRWQGTLNYYLNK